MTIFQATPQQREKSQQQQKRYSREELVKMGYVGKMSVMKINIAKNPIQANLANGYKIVIDGEKKLTQLKEKANLA